ncbi:MAG: hypothetical protein ABSD44_12900, partial [Terracidiphilus sp.]
TPPNGSYVDVCSSVLLFSAILGCQRTEPPLKPLSEFDEPALCENASLDDKAEVQSNKWSINDLSQVAP